MTSTLQVHGNICEHAAHVRVNPHPSLYTYIHCVPTYNKKEKKHLKACPLAHSLKLENTEIGLGLVRNDIHICEPFHI